MLSKKTWMKNLFWGLVTAGKNYKKQHRPTHLQVKCQETRSRDSNRFFARKILCEKITFLLHKEKSEKQSQIFKIRKQKKRRSKKAKQKMMDEKRKRSDRKKLRKTPGLNE